MFRDDRPVRTGYERARSELDAMSLYKKLQSESEKAINEYKDKKANEQRIINEKQIRQLRHSYRRPGIMKSTSAPMAPNSQAMSTEEPQLATPTSA